ncbi:DUF6338 family protein [Streptomyces sp. NBC_01443]|uniref:DUF6338 family protein n=1 Tax=Streptomyces sp. NBC_01443 TaxID=2903868 RepID=UPI002251457B|nr:DUF6338 family protein [Streptomyces sp. NBC_01443]MCX4632874.1 DUF6338 family protein [Streptomyces sp. NBC_01443]
MLPSTVQQIAVLLIMVLPGAVYQAVAERLRGPSPYATQGTESRVLRALTASALLDSLYILAVGPWLLSLAKDDKGRPLAGLAQNARLAAAAALLMIVLIPAGLAWFEAWLRGRKAAARHIAVPTGWDHLFTKRSSCFVRIRTKDGRWVGGWYSGDSYAAAYPQSRDIFLQSQYLMSPDGRFGPRLAKTGGVYVPAESIDVLEVLES